MLQLMSLVLFTSIMAISIAVIIGTIKAEMPAILKALGIEPAIYRPLPPTGERRVRVIRQPMARSAMRSELRAVA